MLTQRWREGMGGSLSRYYPQASWVMEGQVGRKAWHQGHQNPQGPVVG